ncbi:sugar kinase [Sporosarcina thermotolerans]|uniref:Sugar kinase n=1 Tax=Sporosarcina thermotolerans TaxID=633404 RepID=A0AAW9A5L3_9BACL|nr:sugar kinase [Sporosarcina thermotolerans]MDW0116189.1 sugar kinase [Sporosarcina thermotolerans]WHT48165.1 sugar kinase [Sporosarcina thermotolerans]
MFPELVTIGETMVVLEAAEEGRLRYVPRFNKKQGGAESNVAIGVARLGHTSGWISKVGDDELGKYIVSSIRGEGVDTSRVLYNQDYPTGLYIKERVTPEKTQVYYYRSNSAASQLTKEDIDWNYLKEAKIIHISGITPFLSESCLEVTQAVADFAKKNNIFLSFDPNLRFKLMANVENAKEILLQLAKQADLFMPGIDEAEYLVGTRDYEEIAEYFLSAGVSKIVIKNGEKETFYASKNGVAGTVPSFKVERVVDPVGAGDGFAAGLLTGLLEDKSLQESVEIGAKVGAMVVTARGDIEGLPERSELENFHNKILDVLR